MQEYSYSLDYDLLVKVLVIGNSAVGKSCLLLRYADDTFVETHGATIGVDFKLKTQNVDGKTCKIQIWDTAGQERFRAITSAYYNGANGVFVVYDITNRESYKQVPQWIHELKQNAQENVQIVLIGNKSDLAHKRQVSYDEGEEMAKELGVSFFETSAKTSQNVQMVFQEMIHSLIKNRNYMSNTCKTDTVPNPTPFPYPSQTSSSCCLK